MKDSTAIPGHVLGLDADEVEVGFDFTPGEPAQTSGPPEMCDPGSGPEIEDVTATLDGAALILTPEQEGKAVEWLYANHSFDDDYDDGPDWDAAYDQQRDDRLTGDD